MDPESEITDIPLVLAMPQIDMPCSFVVRTYSGNALPDPDSEQFPVHPY